MDIIILRRLVDYNQLTGEMYWREAWPELFGHSEARPASYRCNIWNSANAGKAAFAGDNGKGYLQGRFLGVAYKAHRVAWAHYHGEWPALFIDHINHVKSDNRITNLRLVTFADNMKNLGVSKGNKTGVKGVSWCVRDQAWVVQTSFNGTRLRKNFKNFDDAVTYRLEQISSLGFHPNHGLSLTQIRQSNHTKNRSDDCTRPSV